ncbi:adhesion G-protein coupled receptor G2-like isoform X2 [Leguminivora glycinivorella]|uniref:adhesion G-protein coupled receptor G2-like isoform X2 n=1 Tax=Leguminivora glycinivorella TaxID=1035111 RepID=UPI00200F4D7F|nr:adhesion G-protein coupled receptor G2-like isoform X2 [Leguminivora glycinivorella]
MLSQKNRPYSRTMHKHQPKRNRISFKYLQLNTTITIYLIAALILSVKATDDMRYRPHRPPWKGPPQFISPPPPHDPVKGGDGSDNTVHIVDMTTITPEMDGDDGFIHDTTRDKEPEEELHEMIEGLDELLSNDSAVVTINDVSNAFDQMDALLSTDDSSLEFPNAVLTALDTLGTRADLNGSDAVKTARRNVAVIMADSLPGWPVRGLRIPVDGFTDEGIQLIQGADELDLTTLTGEDTEAAINLPASLADSSRRVSFVVFRSDRAFIRHDREQYVVNSKIISVNVENFTQMADGEVIDIYLKPSVYKPARNMSRSCAYWQFAENDTGYWSQEGCTFIKSPTGFLDTCRCTHLTHFAEVLVPKHVFSEENESALEVISLVGCFLSLFGLLMIVLTAIMFRSWRIDFNNKIWIQLTLALLINVISFLIIVFSKFEDYNSFCMTVGIILHYAVLASFCWMLVAAVISYRKLVLIFATDPRRRLLKASAFSWSFPLIIVGILVIVAPQSYTKRFEEHTPTGAFCYPTGVGLWVTVYAPITIVVISNWVLFALILRSVFGTKKIQKHGDSGEMLRRASVSCLLVFLFGLPWIFGLFAYNIVAAYLFTLTTSYQGFVLFIFFIIINTKTRGMWLDKLRIKKKSKTQVSSSLITSKNARISNEPEQTPFIESNSSRTNVTSLVSDSSDGKAVAYNVASSSAAIGNSHYISKDSIDSYITAKSHDNFSEDEIFKSVEGIFDIIEDDEQKNTKHKSMPGTPSRNSLHSYKSLLKEEVQRNNEETSNKDGISDNSSQKVGYDEDFINPEITVYNVATQNASLIS